MCVVKHGAGGHGLAGGGEVDALLLHQGADALEAAKGAMALVHVADRRRLAQRPQRADAADAEDHFLADAHVHVAAVEAGRDRAVFRRVLRDVGVEQVERHAADLDAPDAELHLAAGERHSDEQGRAVVADLRDQRQVEEVVFRVALLLPAVHGEVLAEVALAVHEADADERQAEVAGALEVVAAEDAEAAGVDRHALMDAELGAEVGDAEVRRQRDRGGRSGGRRRLAVAVAGAAGVGFLIPGGGGHVVVERFFDAIHVGEEAVVVQQFVPAATG